MCMFLWVVIEVIVMWILVGLNVGRYWLMQLEVMFMFVWVKKWKMWVSRWCFWLVRLVCQVLMFCVMGILCISQCICFEVMKVLYVQGYQKGLYFVFFEKRDGLLLIIMGCFLVFICGVFIVEVVCCVVYFGQVNCFFGLGCWGGFVQDFWYYVD